jgi:hypothetical protein
VYNRLRDRLRRISMMRTWSVYLVGLEYRDQVLAILKDLDNDADTKARILYDFTKIDPSESAKIDKWVKEQFAANVKRIKGELQQKLGEAETLFDDGELILKDKALVQRSYLSKAMKLILKDKALVQRSYLSKAMKKVKEAKRLSHVFDVIGVMEAALTAVEKLVEARRARIKSDLEAEAKRLKEEAAKEEVKAEAAA